MIYFVEVHRTRSGSSRYYKAFTVGAGNVPVTESKNIAATLHASYCDIRAAVQLPGSLTMQTIAARLSRAYNRSVDVQLLTN